MSLPPGPSSVPFNRDAPYACFLCKKTFCTEVQYLTHRDPERSSLVECVPMPPRVWSK